MGKMGGAPAMGSGGAAPIVDPIPGDTGGTDGGVIDATGGASNGTGGQQGGTCVPTAEVCDGLDNNCENGTADEMCPSECKGLAIAGRGYMFCGARELTWLESQKFCVDHGMSLLKLETADENTQVLAAAAGLPNGGIEWAWLGATDIANEGSWVWEGGVHFWQGEANGMPVDGRFSAWMESQPNNSNGEEHCARAFPATANWTDGDCGVTSAGLICEAD